MQELRDEEAQFWDAYVRTLPEANRPSSPSVSASFAGNEKTTDLLLKLYLTGKKTAGSGLVRDYEQAGDPLPRVGDYWIVLDRNRRPGCIVKTVRVEINKFEKVPESIAIAEGEGDLSLRHWRAVHTSFFSPLLSGLGIEDLNAALVVTEHFEVVFGAQALGPS